MHKICKQCGKVFEPRHLNAALCSDECRIERKRNHDKEYYEENKEHILERCKIYVAKNRTKRNDQKRSHYYENKELILEKQKEYHNNNKIERNAKQREYYLKNSNVICHIRKDNKPAKKKRQEPIREWAQRKVRIAKKHGDMVNVPCEFCGRTDIVEAHHEDYSKPLDVWHLCRRHHAARHVTLRVMDYETH